MFEEASGASQCVCVCVCGLGFMWGPKSVYTLWGRELLMGTGSSHLVNQQLLGKDKF